MVDIPLMSARGHASPMRGGGNALHVAELMRLSDKGSSKRRPAAPAIAAQAAQIARAAGAGGFGSVVSQPSWNDAAIQVCVMQSIQAIVQPRLDSFAERLGGIVASAQEDLTDFQTFVDRIEARTDGRLTGLEARVAVLADGASRAEQRERDLNARIAGFAEGVLSRGVDEGVACAAEAPWTTSSGSAALQRLDDTERNVREALSRVQTTEDVCRKGATNARFLEDRVKDLEMRSRTTSRVTEEMRSSLEDMSARTPRRGDAGCDSGVATLAHALATASAAAQTATATQAAISAQSSRTSALEEQVIVLNELIASSGLAPLGEKDDQAAAVASAQSRLVDALRADLEVLTSQCGELRSQVVDHSRQLEAHCEAQNTKPAVELQKAISARVDDINLRTGTLKVKCDSLEGRLQVVSERAEAARHSPEVRHAQDQLQERCNRLESMRCEERLEAAERQLNNFQDACEDLVEQALNRRLSVLSGAAPPRHRGRGSRLDLAASSPAPLSPASPRASTLTQPALHF